MSRPKLSAPITIRELAVRLELPEPHRVSTLRRLRRQIARRQRRLRAEGHDVTLLHTDSPRAPTTVTEAQLRVHMEELFDKKSEIVEAVKASQEELRSVVETLLAKVNMLTRRIISMEMGR